MITRRQFCLGTLSLLLPRWLQSAQPSIVLITADDLGYGSLGCYGQEAIQTPNLDALAASGLRFTQAYAPAPVCAPSRWGLMTGQHIGQSPTMINSQIILRQEVTVAERLREVGYVTACFGKWGLGYPAAGSSPARKGFDYFLGYMTHGEAHDYYAPYLWENDTPFYLPANRNGQRGVYIPDLLTQKAIEFISQARKPFFLYLPYNSPHINSQSGEFEVPSDAPYTNQPWNQNEKNYAAMITRLDNYIGQLLQVLPSNTLIIFSSDNGSDYPQMFKSNGDLRAGKSTLYEGGIRVPLIASGPGIEPGIEERPAWLVNFLKVALSGDVEQFVEPGPMYWAFEAPTLSEAVRLGDFKGIRTEAGWELYNLASDPGETVNLASGYPELIWQMKQVMDRYYPAPKVCELRLPLVGND